MFHIKIVGGVNFYARREIKDLLAYLRVIENPEDDLAVLRIINVPRRGIGAATINKVQDWEAEQGIRFYDALLEAEYVPGLMRSLNKIKIPSRPFYRYSARKQIICRSKSC